MMQALLARREQRPILLLLLVLLLGGCAMSTTVPVNRSFLLNLPSATPTSPLAAGSLALGSVTVLAPYNDKGLVLRTGEVAYSIDPYNEWAASPTAMWRNASENWLAERALFGRVLTQGLGDATFTMDMSVLEAVIDRRSARAPQAVVKQRFVLQRNEKAALIVLDRSYRHSVPVSGPQADDEVAAISAAALANLQDFEADLHGAALAP